MLMENRLNGHDVKNFEALAQRINALDRGDVNKMIKATYPPFKDMLRIIVTPDRDAIKDACGAWIYHLPATPQKVKAALADARKK